MQTVEREKHESAHLDDIDEFQVSADAFNVMSLFGWKLSDQWAISALGEFRTSILDDKFVRATDDFGVVSADGSSIDHDSAFGMPADGCFTCPKIEPAGSILTI